MVRVFAAQVVNMQRDQRMIDQTLEKLTDEINVESTDHGPPEIDDEGQSRSAGEIDNDPRQRLVERHIGMAVAAQPLLVAECLVQRLTEGNADIFYGVMRIDMQIALGFDRQIDHPVPGNLIEHVIEKGNAGGKLALPAPVKVQTNRYLGFECISGDFDLPHGGTVAKWRKK